MAALITKRLAIHSLFAAFLLVSAGCASKNVTISDTFPTGGYASPWILDSPVWCGEPDEASFAVGDEYPEWKAFNPKRLWLAVYRHDSRRDNTITVRAWSFPNSEQARRAYEKFRPENASALKAGDEACWTKDGILVLWGRMIFDIFDTNASGASSPEQAVYLLAFFEKKMPHDLPYNPQ